jgi:acyl-coenzyme A synthetase/AMP-(fatty) acid ligase/D-alanine-D-alanine ligase-like ATP-grasp enzyme
MQETSGLNVTAELRTYAQVCPNATAIVLDDRTISYAELDDAVWRTLGWLREAGVRPGMIVGLIMSDQISLLLAMLGLMRLGATAFPLSPSAPPLQQEGLLREAGASIVLSNPGKPTLQGLQILGFHEGDLRPISHDQPRSLGGTAAPCLLIPGSGTTGQPRLIPYTHSVMRRRIDYKRKLYGLKEADRLMVLSPLHFQSSNNRILSALFNGGSGIICSRNYYLNRSIMSLSPNILHLSVIHAEILLKQQEIDKLLNFSPIRVVSIGSSTISEDLRKRLRENLHARLHIIYGTNEIASISVARPEDLIAAPGCVGRPVEGVQVEILDEAGTPLGPGQVGRLRAKSDAQIAGYLHDVDGEAFHDGWFYPGDLAMLSESGHLFHCGRADHMMIMNGINIYPAEIERILEQHSTVRDVVAFPLKHPIAQDIPVCAVVLHPGATSSRADLTAFARERLGARAPRFIAILAAIPRNEQGKPQRAELRRLVEAQLRPMSPPPVLHTTASPAVPHGQALTAERHVRQPSRRINLDFQPPRVLQTGAIDAWLAILNPDFGPSRSAASQKTAEAQGGHVADWLERVMLLARELLQVAQIPVFDALSLVSCGPQGQGRQLWRAVIAVPTLDHVPMRVFEIAFGAAVRSASGTMTQAPTSASQQAFFEQLLREAIQPLMRLASGGKSTLPLLRVAHARGIPFRSLGGGLFQLGLGAKGRLTDRSTNDRDTAIGLKLAQSKPLTAQVLRLAGLPAPTHQVVTSTADGRAAADRLGWPVVVKPADLDRGEGVSVDVDEAGLERAFEAAQRLSTTKQVIVERQVQGVCHRLFLASGRLLYAVKRLPMGVYGDGLRSVEALVADALTEQAKLPPWRRSELRPIDDLAHAAIAAAGFQLTSVPHARQFVPFRRIESTAWGGVDEEVTDSVHPENLRVALAAAELFGLDVVGVDIISPDISEPWYANGAIINEVNFAPLLGGGEISRRYIDEYLNRLLEGDGRIPIEAFVGGEEAWSAALARRKALGDDGAGIFVTNARRTLDGNGHEIPMPFQSLHGRSRALLLSRQVRALLLVVQDDEWLRTGLPVEYLDRVVDSSGALRQHRNPDLPLPKEQEQALRQLLAERLQATAA